MEEIVFAAQAAEAMTRVQQNLVLEGEPGTTP
jgi:hypothetical protein